MPIMICCYAKALGVCGTVSEKLMDILAMVLTSRSREAVGVC